MYFYPIFVVKHNNLQRDLSIKLINSMKYSLNTQFRSSKTTFKSESLKKNTHLKSKPSFNSTSEFNLSQSVYKPFSNTSYNIKLSKINTSDCFSKKALSSTLASSLMSKRSIHSGNCEQRKSCILKVFIV